MSYGIVAIIVLRVSSLSAHLVTPKTVEEIGELKERETGAGEF
jgi:hypothetical protein